MSCFFPINTHPVQGSFRFTVPPLGPARTLARILRRLVLSLGLAAGCLGAAPSDEILVFDGRVVQASGFPRPADNPYADCLFTVKVEPLTEAGQSQPVVLALFAFTNRQATAESRIQAGHLLRVHARDINAMPEAYRETQIQDDIEELDLPLYAGLRAEPVAALEIPMPRTLKQAPPTGRSLQPARNTPESARRRAERIAADLESVRELVRTHPDWAAWHAELQPRHDELRARLADAPGGFLQKGEVVFEHPAVLDYILADDDPWYQNVLAAFANLQEQFARAGTDLILLPVPQRDEVCASVFLDPPPPEGIVQPYWLKFQADLLSRGIEVVDVFPAFREQILQDPAPYVHASRDGHPGPGGVEILARAVAERLKRYSFDAPRRAYRLEPGQPLPIGTNLYYSPTHFPTYTRVLEPEGGPVQADPLSEILIIGDSMVTAPPAAHNGSFGVHLAEKTGIPMTFFKHAGNAHAMALHLAKDLGLESGSNRRVCVFIFTASHLCRRPLKWSTRPFLDSLLNRECLGPLDGEWERAAPLVHIQEGGELARMLGPGEAARASSAGGGARLIGREFPFPVWPPNPADHWLVRLKVDAKAAAQWTVVAGNGQEQPLSIPAGISLVTFPLSFSGAGFCGLRLPAAPEPPILYSLSVRQQSPAPAQPPTNGLSADLPRNLRE